MTDYTKLTERLRTDAIFDNTTLGNEAADAIEAMQSKLGDAIQSSAHWQHQCTELQVENERLKEEAKQWQSLSELSLGMAEAHSKERNQLQAKLDDLSKQKPVGFVAPHDLKTLREGYPATVVMLSGHKRTQPLYAAPKALAPELVNCDACVYHYKEADQKPCNTCVHARDFYDNFEPRVAKGTP